MLGINKLLNWILWKGIVRYTARSFGILDPFTVLSKVRRFAKPSEVAEPGELLRAGVVFHARGLMNRAIQYNEDWVWPHWAERQFNAHDPAFIPRAFSLTHINLTHRNWTAVGLPGVRELPLVDPRGLVTPYLDSWSLDVWMIDNDGKRLFPSRCDSVDQSQSETGNLEVTTKATKHNMEVTSRVSMIRQGDSAACRIKISAHAEQDAKLVISLRPYNPEGISFIYDVKLSENGRSWKVDDDIVNFTRRPDQHITSDYHQGDVNLFLDSDRNDKKQHCDVGMVTAAAIYDVPAGESLDMEVYIPVEEEASIASGMTPVQEWDNALKKASDLNIPDEQLQSIYTAALRTLVLHTQGRDVFPGPFMYKRFWFRDAAFILSAMIAANLTDKTRKVLDSFEERQSATGYFLSQEGEWDSNGEALWVMGRYCDLTGNKPHPEWKKAIQKAADWICRKRIDDKSDERYGLYPAGFSAEHLGLNDYYYWDDFWGVAGLHEAARMMDAMNEKEDAEKYRKEADDFLACIMNYLYRDQQRLGTPVMPAAPGRRLDGGMIGNMVAGYPLAILEPDDAHMVATTDYLHDHYCNDGAFLHHVGHSGYNAYLTLHIAQNMLRRGDMRLWPLIHGVADRASQTGHWPEAIHPATGGGCMGDGQHVWAAAEWVMMMRNLFVYEEDAAQKIVIGAGLKPEWLDQEKVLSFGTTRTKWGKLSVSIEPKGDEIHVTCDAEWFHEPPRIEIRIPGCETCDMDTSSQTTTVKRTSA